MSYLNLDKLKQLRKGNKLSQEEMANLFGFKSLYSYNRKELGHVKFSADELYKIAKYFGVSIEYFFENNVAKNATSKKKEVS